MRLQKKRIVSAIIISVLIAGVVGASGCIAPGLESVLEGLHTPQHDEADYIPVDYVKEGHYYFEDDFGRSFNKTLYEGDTSALSRKFNPNDWIYYVQGLKFIKDANDMEIFYNVSETLERGGGDCEDRAILLARGLYDMGFDTCIIVQKSHVLAGISKSQVDSRYKGILMSFSKPKTYKGVEVDGYYPIETTIHWGISEYDENPLKYEKMYVLGQTPAESGR